MRRSAASKRGIERACSKHFNKLVAMIVIKITHQLAPATSSVDRYFRCGKCGSTRVQVRRAKEHRQVAKGRLHHLAKARVTERYRLAVVRSSSHLVHIR